MIVTYEDNGVPKIMEHTFPTEVRNKDFLKEIESNLHKHNVREQMVADFKTMCGDEPSDVTLGWALDEIKNKRYLSKIERIEFHYGKTLKNFNVKFKQYEQDNHN